MRRWPEDRWRRALTPLTAPRWRRNLCRQHNVSMTKRPILLTSQYSSATCETGRLVISYLAATLMCCLSGAVPRTEVVLLQHSGWLHGKYIKTIWLVRFAKQKGKKCREHVLGIEWRHLLYFTTGNRVFAIGSYYLPVGFELMTGIFRFQSVFAGQWKYAWTFKIYIS